METSTSRLLPYRSYVLPLYTQELNKNYKIPFIVSLAINMPGINLCPSPSCRKHDVVRRNMSAKPRIKNKEKSSDKFRYEKNMI